MVTLIRLGHVDTTMPSLRIPESARPGFLKIAAASDEEMMDLLAALEVEPLPSLPTELVEQIASRLKKLSKDDASSILSAVLGLYGIISDSEIPTSQLVEDVWTCLENLKTGSQSPPTDRSELFRQRLIRLLSFGNSLGISSKAIDVMSEHDRVLCGMRVLTDVRAVFGKPSEKPAAACIIHTLKLTFHQNGQHKDFFVAMDASDLRQLKSALERAEQKAQSLQALLKEAKIRNLN